MKRNRDAVFRRFIVSLCYTNSTMRTVRTAMINSRRQVTFTPQELLEVGVDIGDQFAVTVDMGIITLTPLAVKEKDT